MDGEEGFRESFFWLVGKTEVSLRRLGGRRVLVGGFSVAAGGAVFVLSRRVLSISRVAAFWSIKSFTVDLRAAKRSALAGGASSDISEGDMGMEW
jgi:hypothetical protein